MVGEVRKPCGWRTAQHNIHPPPNRRQQVPDAVDSAQATCFFPLAFYAKCFKVLYVCLQKCCKVNSFVLFSIGTLQPSLVFLNGCEGRGQQGGRLLSFSKPIESVASECVVFLTRASARLMGVCLGAFRRRSRRLFTKTYVSDYDRWGLGPGLGGAG